MITATVTSHVGGGWLLKVRRRDQLVRHGPYRTFEEACAARKQALKGMMEGGDEADGK